MRLLFCAGALEPVIATAIQRQLAIVQMQDRGWNAVQEGTVMADDQQCARIARQIAFQPQRRFQVQMVGRFIQQQDIGFAKQRRCQRDAHPPATGKCVQRAVLHVLVKAQTCQNAGRAGFCTVAIQVNQARMDFANIRVVRFIFRRMHQFRQFDMGRDDGLQRGLAAVRLFLGNGADTVPVAGFDGPAINWNIAGDQAQQGRLAGPVGANNTNTVSIGHRGRGPVQQGSTANAVGKVFDLQHSDSRIAWSEQIGNHSIAHFRLLEEKTRGLKGHGMPSIRRAQCNMSPTVKGGRSHSRDLSSFKHTGSRLTRFPREGQRDTMALEQTFSIIKPDATRRNLTGKINAMLEDAGLRIVAQKRIHMTTQQAEQFYGVHKERAFFPDLVKFMTSGPVVVQVLEGENAVLKNREVMGATNPANADEGTIRKLYGESVEANSAHGSDSPENAAIEIAYFFAGTELVG